MSFNQRNSIGLALRQQHMKDRTQSGYFLEIEGLRALAIVAVLLFHLNSAWLPGGFFGVDVFFVISGFLITRLILPQIDAGSFSFRQFYLRRAKRLLPVFLVMLMLTWIAAWQLFFPAGLQSLSRASFAAVLSFANYEFAKQLDYFASASEANPLLHTWSLAVEEQFYFLFPLILVLTRHCRISEKWRWIGGGCVTILFFSFSCLLTQLKPNQAFYVLEARAWELGLGCLTAILFEKIQLSGALRTTLSWSGLALCIASFTMIGESAFIPSPTALIPTLGSALLILCRCGGAQSPLYRMAIWAPARYLGRLSYSLYLFHWPVIVFYKAASSHWGLQEQLYCAALSMFLAIMVHHTVENPIRFSKNPMLLRKLAYLGLTTVLILTLGSKGVRFADGYIGAPYEAWLRRVHPDCDQSKPTAAKLLPAGVKDRPAEIILIGDSHAQCLVHAFDEALTKAAQSGAYWVAPGTVPAMGVHTSEYSESFVKILPKIAQQNARIVVICASWPVYFNQSKNGLSQQESDQVVVGGLSATIQTLVKAGKRVILMHSIPRMDRHVPEYMARTLKAGQPLLSHLVTTPEYLKSTQSISDLLLKLSASKNVIHVYPKDWLSESDRILYQEAGLAFYADSNHVTVTGARRIIPGLLKAAWPESKAPKEQSR